MQVLAQPRERSLKNPSTLERWTRRLALGRLARLQRGLLRIHDPLGISEFGAASEHEPSAEIFVSDLAFYPKLAFNGSLGAADSYLEGEWQGSSLVELFRLFVRNPELNSGVEKGVARATAPFQKLRYRLRKNTRVGSRRNISDHYDLSNELFELFLDPTLSYSSAIYPHPDATLDEAAVHKLDVICEKLQLTASDHLLEIGTGWGGLAIHMARKTGCRVTTTTISKEQYELAKERIEAAGLTDRIEVLLKDYRDLTGRYDKLVSIEMIEAVGAEYYGEFFSCCSDLLKDDGLMLLQAITIADRMFEQSRYEVDFIKRYIFPGSCIPSVGAITQATGGSTDLDMIDLEDIGLHYARTLHDWRENFTARREDVLELGFDERFMRMWEYYLTYCEAGFIERQIRDVQMIFAKPFNRRQPLQWDAQGSRTS